MLTTAKVRDLKPRSAMYEVTCAAMPGFIVRVLPTGKKVFVVRYRVDGTDRRERLGLWGSELTVEEARRQAVLRASGADPSPPAGPPAPTPRAARSAPRRAASAPPKAVPEPRAEPVEPKRSRATVRELAERFLREYVDVYLKDGTAVNYRHCINDVIVPALGDREFDTITRRDAQTLHASLRATPCTADYVLSVLGSFYTRILIDWEMSEMRNPTHAIKRFGSHKRERFLSPEERRRLREVMDAGLRTPAGKAGHIEPVSAWALQLLAMTGLAPRRDPPAHLAEHRLAARPAAPARHQDRAAHGHDLVAGDRAAQGDPRPPRQPPQRPRRPVAHGQHAAQPQHHLAPPARGRRHPRRAPARPPPLVRQRRADGRRAAGDRRRDARPPPALDDHLADNVVRQAVEHTTSRIVEAERTVTAALSLPHTCRCAIPSGPQSSHSSAATVAPAACR